jgi:MFS family permease
MQKVDELEQAVILLDNQDGVGDIFAGLFILSFGIGMLSEIFWFGAILVPALFPVWQEVRKRLAARRLGHVETTPAQVNRAKIRLALIVVVGLGTLLLGLVFFLIFSQESFLHGLRSWLQEYFELSMGGVATLLLVLVGAIKGTARFYFYAALALAVFTTGYFLGVGLGISMTLLGALIILAGLFVLIQFLREHPVLERN